MSRNAWLTENSIPSGRRDYVISLPDDEAWRADFLGAFLLLTQEANWEEFGILTPLDMADEWLDVFLEFETEAIPMIPAGVVFEFSGASLPSGFLWADGSAISRTTYAALFAAIGTVFGVGNGTTTFNVPNRSGKVAVGRDTSQTEFDTLGETGGSKTHTLTTAELAIHTHVQNEHTHAGNAHTHTQDAHTHTQSAHTHTQDAHTHTQNSHNHQMARQNTAGAAEYALVSTDLVGSSIVTSAAFVATVTPTNQNATAVNQNTTATTLNATPTNQSFAHTNQNTTPTNQNTGSGSAHNNLQPYLVQNFIIKY